MGNEESCLSPIISLFADPTPGFGNLRQHSSQMFLTWHPMRMLEPVWCVYFSYLPGVRHHKPLPAAENFSIVKACECPNRIIKIAYIKCL